MTVDETAVVVITGSGQPAREIRRCLSEVLSTVPLATDVHVINGGRLGLDPATAARVRVHLVHHESLAKKILSDLVQRPHPMITIDSAFSVRGDWFQKVLSRVPEKASLASTFQDGSHFIFAYPRGVTAVNSLSTRMPENPDIRLVSRGFRNHVPHQMISGLIIAKDESQNIRECVLATAPFVDEVVVYDTGSSDDTRLEAQLAGATVVTGYWNNNFADARNRAAENASHDWVFFVDADERPTGDPAAFRALIDHTAADVMSVPQVSVGWRNGQDGHVMHQFRIFQRSRAHYVGALHEQVVPLPGSSEFQIVAETDDSVRLRHFGYMRTNIVGADKVARNLAVSKEAFEACHPSDRRYGETAANYARSLSDQDPELGLVVLNQLLDDSSVAAGSLVIAGRCATGLNFSAGNLEMFDRWVDVMERGGEAPGEVACMRAERLMAAGDHIAAIDLLKAFDVDPSTGGIDLWGNSFSPDRATALLAVAQVRSGDAEEAACTMLRALRERPDTLEMSALFEVLHAAGWRMGDLVGAAPDQFIDRSIREFAYMDPEVALAWYSAIYAADAKDLRPIVGGCSIASRQNWLTALTWQARAAESGLDLHPLLELAEEQATPLVDKIMAWAMLAEGFNNEVAIQHVIDILEDLEPGHQGEALSLLNLYAPRTVQQLQLLVSTGG